MTGTVLNKNEKINLKTAQFHYRCTSAKMERIKKTANSHNISMQEYFDYLLDRDIASIPMQMDLIQHQLHELKKVQKLIFLNTEILGMYFNRFLFYFYSRLETFETTELKEKGYKKGQEGLANFIKGITDTIESRDNCSFLHGVFWNILNEDKDYLNKLNSRLMDESVF